MKIDSVSAAYEPYKVSPKAAAISHAEPVKGHSPQDKLTISQNAREIQLAFKAVRDCPDVREDLVNSLSARIKSGTYNVTAADVAEKLVNEYYA